MYVYIGPECKKKKNNNTWSNQLTMKKISVRRFSWPLFSILLSIRSRHVYSTNVAQQREIQSERNTACVWKSKRNTHAAIIRITITVFRCPRRQCHWRARVLKTFFLLLLVFFFFTITGVLFDRVRRGADRSQKNIRHRTRFQNGYVWKRDFLFT